MKLSMEDSDTISLERSVIVTKVAKQANATNIPDLSAFSSIIY